MVRVIFVHGTGVRSPRMNDVYFKPFAEGLSGELVAGPPVRFVNCGWGDELGVTREAGAHTLPPKGSFRGEESEGSPENQLWLALEEDPMSEIRAALDARPDDVLPPIDPSLPDPAVVRLRELSVGEMADEIGLAPWLGTAANTVADELEVADAEEAGLREEIGRAVVATALQLADAELGESFPIIAADRDRMAEAITAAVIQSHRGAIGELALRVRHRTMPWVTGTGGDIFTYLVRGERLRAYIRTCLEKSTEPTVLVGHSLGGVAAVDLLVGAPMEQVHALVTVGSQAPYLHAINALPSLSHTEMLPQHFPRWINVFDPNDLLAFLGSPVFGERVSDRPARSGVPFPRAHRSYMTNPEFHRIVADEVARCPS